MYYCGMVTFPLRIGNIECQETTRQIKVKQIKLKLQVRKKRNISKPLQS